MKTGTLFLDKSAFEALSREHAGLLQLVFVQGLTPVLVYEILADLTKVRVAGTASAFVQLLAAKFGGGGGVVNIPYQELVVGELLGRGSVPMTGQIIPQGASFHDVGGEGAALIDLTNFNHAVLRWSHGHFESSDVDLALAWRTAARNLSLLEFSAHIGRNQIHLPRPRPDWSDLFAIVEGVLGDRDRQGAWITYILGQLHAGSAIQNHVAKRWLRSPAANLHQFAPYTAFCLRAFVAVSTLWAHRLTKREPNNYLDLQYLYYLPFCQYFGSQDKLQLKLAPLMMRDDQSVLTVEQLREAASDRRRPGDGRRAG